MLTIRPGDHIGAAFTGRDEFVAHTRSFIGQGLAAGAKVMVIPSLDGHDEIRHRIVGHGPSHRHGHGRGIADAVAARRIEFGDRRVRWALSQFEPVRLMRAYAAAADQAVAEGHSGLWVSVDMMWADAAGVEPRALTEFEAASFPLFTEGRLTMLCQYDTQVFTPRLVREACRAHPANLSVQWRLERTAGRAGLRLSGEADLSNHDAWAAVVAALPADADLDVSAMSFMDVPAMTALVRAAVTRPAMTLTVTAIQAGVLDRLGIGETPAAVLVVPEPSACRPAPSLVG